MIEIVVTAVLAGGSAVAATLYLTREKRRDLLDTARDLNAREDRVSADEKRVDLKWAQESELMDNIAQSWAEVDWMRKQQATYHVEMCRWRDRLLAFQFDLDARDKATAPAERPTGPTSVDALRAQFDALMVTGGVSAHLQAVYGGADHFLSAAMPAEVHDLVDHAHVGPILHDQLVEVLLEATGTMPIVEPEVECDGPEPTAPETPVVETAMAGQPNPGTGPTDDAHRPPPNPAPGKLSARDQAIRMRDIARLGAAQKTADEHAAAGAR